MAAPSSESPFISGWYWLRWHSVLAVAVMGLALAHIGGVSHYAGTWWKQALWMAIGGSCFGVLAY